MKTPQLALIVCVAAALVLSGALAAMEQGDVATTEPVASEASETDASARYPCEHQQQFREFDFWIGEWEVRNAEGELAGHNVIEASQRGCVLIENWTGAAGGTGTSMNYLDRTTDEWVQLWTDSSGGQINIRGGMTDHGMLLTGRIHYVSRDVTAPFRGLWTPQADGRVRQFFEQSNDGGESWEPWFEGFYNRVEPGDDGREQANETDK